MKPILYESNEKEFTSNGLGRLSEATNCVVTEERNGSFELSMTIPDTARHFSEIQNTRLILAKPNAVSEPQPFEIYDISKPINGLTEVSARHISYRLSDVPCKPFSAQSVLEALEGFKQNAMVQNDFDFWTDKQTVANYAQDTPASIRERLGGVQGSILDCYGGEYEFDRFMVKLWNQRGINRGVTIRYGKNLTDAKQEQSIANTATGIVGMWKGQVDSNDVVIYTDVVYSENDTKFPYHKVKVIDFSSEFQDQPSKETLTERAQQYILANNIGVPEVSLEVSFIDLADTEEYKQLAREQIGLCDYVTVQFDKIGINTAAEVTRTEYDVLKERYNSITLGTFYSLASTINGIDSNITQTKTEMTTELQKAKDNATKQITGANGGYVKTVLDANGKPCELLIMDTDSIETAQRVWRWNENGLGYSETGYNGTYKLAMTQDGAIVADFITTGNLIANIIQTGILKDKKGLNFWNLDTGEFQLQAVSSLQEVAIKGVDVQYAISESNTAAPTTGWQTNAPAWSEGHYIWQRTATTYADDSVHYSDALCITGVKGDNGINGINNFIHIKYAPVENPTDSQITETPNDYIGLCVDQNQSDPTTASSYEWSKFKGTDGENGIPGKDSYVHFAYANSADGKTDFSVSEFEGAEYIGVYTDHALQDSQHPEDYAWSLIKGDTGTGVSEIVEEYYLSDSNQGTSGGSWTTTCPTWSENHYIYTRSRITWTDGTETTTEPVIADAINSANQNAESANNAVSSLDKSLDQSGIFDRLTNNGQTQGIYLYDGKLYINADYIKSGTLSGIVLESSGGGVSGWSNTVRIHDGLIEWSDDYGRSYGRIGIYDGGFTFMGNDLYMSGNCEVSGYFSATGDISTSGNLTATGDLTVYDSATIRNGLVVSGETTLNGNVSLGGTINIANGVVFNVLSSYSISNQKIEFRINNRTRSNALEYRIGGSGSWLVPVGR